MGKKKSAFARHWTIFRKNLARNKKFWPTLGFAFVVILVDQLSKLWILYGLRLPERPFGHIEISQIFDLTFVQNRGISFGLFAGGLSSRLILSSLSILVVAYLVRWLARQRRLLTCLGIGAIIGGALGNAFDRLSYGYVVDFIDFSGLHFPWVFNVADMAINLGVGLLILDAVRQLRRKPS